MASRKARVIDVHTHNYTAGWVEMLRNNGDANVQLVQGERYEEIENRGERVCRLSPEMTDFDLRIENMDRAGVDTAVLSLTTPHVFWGSEQVSADTAKMVNDEYAAAEARYGSDRIRWFAALPWLYPDRALEELERAKANGAVGVCLVTNILGEALTAERFRPIWEAVEAADMPAFIHPTNPFVDGMGLQGHGLANTIGFTTDTSLCFARMILDGFLDDFPNLKPIACHGGGALPYLIARFDQMWKKSGGRRKIESLPSSYLRRIWFDAIVYDQATLEFLVEQVGADRVLYGSDYPFLIQDMEGVIERVDALPADQRDAIFETNAVELLKL